MSSNVTQLVYTITSLDDRLTSVESLLTGVISSTATAPAKVTDMNTMLHTRLSTLESSMSVLSQHELPPCPSPADTPAKSTLAGLVYDCAEADGAGNPMVGVNNTRLSGARLAIQGNGYSVADMDGAHPPSNRWTNVDPSSFA